jgi:transposase
MNKLARAAVYPIYVGLDAHKKTIVLSAIRNGEVIAEKVVPTDNLVALRKLLKKLKTGGEMHICYEAGGLGFALHRRITEWGFSCKVIAPTHIPQRPGVKKKCDRLDAKRLAEYLAAGLLTEVRVPTVSEEAARDLVRHRFSLQKDLVKARHRVVKFLRRKGVDYLEGDNWTTAHRAWLEKLSLDNAYDTECMQSLGYSVHALEQRIRTLDLRITEISQTEAYRDSVAFLRAFRGIDTLSAMVLITELGDVKRFANPRALMSYMGLVASVDISGESTKGNRKITKAGNAFCRHVLVQAAWNYSKPPRLSAALRKRQDGVPAWVVAHAWKAQTRLYKRFHQLAARKERAVAATAVARELIGFLGYVLLQHQLGPNRLLEPYVHAGSVEDEADCVTEIDATTDTAPDYETITGGSPPDPATPPGRSELGDSQKQVLPSARRPRLTRSSREASTCPGRSGGGQVTTG